MIVSLTLACGCGHYRFLATSETQPIDGVQTKNKYRLFQFCVKQKGKYVYLNSQAFANTWATFKSAVPNVFSDEGKPIAVYLDYTDGYQTKYDWSIFFPGLITLFTFPTWDHLEWRSHYSIRFKHPKKVAGGLRNSYAVKMERDWNMTIYGPIALCFPYGEPVADGCGYSFFRKQLHVMGSADQSANGAVANSAIAYGAACVLKRLEEEGNLPDVWEDAVERLGSVNGSDVHSPATGGGGNVGVVEIESIPL